MRHDLELPTAPVVPEASWPKIYKLAKLKRRAALMTAGRDMHGIHTVLFLVAQWPELQTPARNYTAHRPRLLYIAITKGWPATLYYDQQGADEFLDVTPDFWTSYQPPPRPRAAQRGPAQPRGRSSTRRGRGKEP
jgi:hypothetical protein